MSVVIKISVNSSLIRSVIIVVVDDGRRGGDWRVRCYWQWWWRWWTSRTICGRPVHWRNIAASTTSDRHESATPPPTRRTYSASRSDSSRPDTWPEPPARPSLRLQWKIPTTLGKGKERKRIYIAPFIYYVYLKALRHGSHSFTCKYTMPAFPSYAFTRWRHLKLR